MKTALARLGNTDLTLSSLFDDFFEVVPADVFGRELFPKVDLDEDEKAIHVKAEMPGLDEKDIEVTLKDRMLTIAGEKKEEKAEENKKSNYRYCERRFGSFSRTIELPEGINIEAVNASYKNGILEIELPKSEAAQPKKINISVN